MANFDKTQVAATVQDLIASEVQIVLNANVVAIPTVRNYSAPAGADKVSFPKIGKFTPAAVVDGVDITSQVATVGVDELDLDQHFAIQATFTDKAKKQSNINLVDEFMNQAGKDMALKMDQYLIDALEGVVGTAYANATDLKKEDILAAKSSLGAANVPMSDRYLLISPASESSLLELDEFVSAEKIADGGATLRNGMIGRIFGFDVLISSQAEDLKSLFYHKMAAVFGKQIEPSIEYFRDTKKLSDLWSVSALWGAEIMQGGSMIVKKGSV
jgi:N4-gp56 family major capsid protein